MQKTTSLLNSISPCRLAPLHPLDGQVAPPVNTILLNVKKRHLLNRKHSLTAAKESFQSLFVVESGSLKTTQVDVWGKEHIRGFYFTGEIFGFEAIPYNQHQYLPAALTDCVVCEISYNHFLEELYNKENADLQRYILYFLSQLLNKRTYLTAVSAEQRVAYFLLDLAERIHSPKKTDSFTLPMTRYDIGSYLNLTAETVSRIFTAMRKLDLIHINHKSIEIRQSESILAIAKGLQHLSF